MPTTDSTSPKPSDAASQAKAGAQETAADAKDAAAETADEAKSAAKDVAETAKSAAKDVTQSAKETAKDLAGQAKSEAEEAAESGKEKATGVLSDVAGALHDTSDSLREHDQNAFADYAEQAASQIEAFTSGIRDRNVGEILDEAERFAKREPGLFIGGAFLLGIFGARFLKASASNATPSASSDRSSMSLPSAGGASRTSPQTTAGTSGYAGGSMAGGSTVASGIGATTTANRTATPAASADVSLPATTTSDPSDTTL